MQGFIGCTAHWIGIHLLNAIAMSYQIASTFEARRNDLAVNFRQLFVVFCGIVFIFGNSPLCKDFSVL